MKKKKRNRKLDHLMPSQENVDRVNAMVKEILDEQDNCNKIKPVEVFLSFPGWVIKGSGSLSDLSSAILSLTRRE